MTDEAISPLRRRMIEDMTIRKLASKTQRDYVQRVKDFAAFLGRSPDTASFEDVRRYQLHLAASGAGVSTLNQSTATLRFFFRVTLGRGDIVNHTQFVHEPRKLPVVLSPEEMARFLDAAPGLKYKAALSVAYGAGLRVSEVVALKVTDIDSKRMVIRVEQGIRPHRQPQSVSTPHEPTRVRNAAMLFDLPWALYQPGRRSLEAHRSTQSLRRSSSFEVHTHLKNHPMTHHQANDLRQPSLPRRPTAAATPIKSP